MQVVAKSPDYQEETFSMDDSGMANPSNRTAKTEWETLSVSELKELLQNAVEEENYELAAKIQEEIDKRDKTVS